MPSGQSGDGGFQFQYGAIRGYGNENVCYIGT